MRWIHDYQLFLFDFDGLLVNTEEIHFQAYQRMCENYGFKLDWNFERYCKVAHYSAEGLREQIYHSLPGLYQAEPDWNLLYSYKKKQMSNLLEAGTIQLMPGVSELLVALQQANIKSCVVTNSPHNQVDIIRRRHPILNTIPHWVTREHYTQPKPHPEGYLLAIQKFSQPNERVIGFEDTPRGIEALLKTSAKPVLVSQITYDDIPSYVTRFASFQEMNPLRSLQNM